MKEIKNNKILPFPLKDEYLDFNEYNYKLLKLLSKNQANVEDDYIFKLSVMDQIKLKYHFITNIKNFNYNEILLYHLIKYYNMTHSKNSRYLILIFLLNYIDSSFLLKNLENYWIEYLFYNTINMNNNHDMLYAQNLLKKNHSMDERLLIFENYFQFGYENFNELKIKLGKLLDYYLDFKQSEEIVDYRLFNFNLFKLKYFLDQNKEDKFYDFIKELYNNEKITDCLFLFKKDIFNIICFYRGFYN
jgi:hypothetical protein